MAPRKKAPEPQPEDVYIPEESLIKSEIDIEDFLDEWGPGTSIVEVYRMKQDGSRPHITRVAIDILKADLYGYLREHCGPGKFCLQFKDASRKIRKSLVVDVEAERGAAPGATAPVNNDFQQQMILALIAAQKPAPPVDVGAILAGMGAMMAALKPSAPAADPSQMLQSITTTFATLKSAAGEEGGIQKALNLINAAKDLVPGGEKSDDSWLGVAKDVTRTVVEVLKPKPNGNGIEPRAALPAVPAGAMPTARVYNADVVPQVADAALGQPKNPEDILKEWIGAQLAFLKTKARAGKDPEFWVEYTLENAEEPGNAAILEAMRRGATFQHLLTFDPEISKDPVLAGWFQRFYEELHAALNEDLDSGGPGGDAPDPGGNGKPSTD